MLGCADAIHGAKKDKGDLGGGKCSADHTKCDKVHIIRLTATLQTV